MTAAPDTRGRPQGRPRPPHAPGDDRRRRRHRSSRQLRRRDPGQPRAHRLPGPGLRGQPEADRGHGARVRADRRRPAGGRRCRRGGHSGRRGRGRHRPGGRARVWRRGGVQRGVRRGGVRARVPRRPRGRGAPPRAAGLRPNCNGIVSPASRTALWGDAFSVPEPGPVALVSQSGNVAVNALATRRGLRFHTVIASGNQAVLTAADYLDVPGRGDRPLPPRRGRRSVPGGRRRAGARRRAWPRAPMPGSRWWY